MFFLKQFRYFVVFFNITGCITFVFYLTIPALASIDSCTKINWKGTSSNPDAKAIMTVPVQINGIRGIVQIDTGSPNSELYGSFSDDEQWTNPSQLSFTPKIFFVGEYKTSPIRFFINRRRVNKRNYVQGKIGIDYFSNKISVFDLKNNFLCISENKSILSKYRGIIWSKAKFQQNRFLITGHFGNKLSDDLLFDTGASVFPVLVPSEMFNYLTETHSKPTTIIRQNGLRNGMKITIFGKQLQRKIIVAGIELKKIQIYLQPEDPVIFIGNKRVDGVVGSMAFDGKVVVIDLRDKPRIGIK